MSERETWATRVGFVLAAVGSAVGLGNVWRFPYVTAENGGAAFILVYLVAVLVVGLPAMLAEFAVGRGSRRNIVDAFDAVGHPGWRFIGLLGLFTGFWILSYYSVIGGWVFRYVAASLLGSYFGNPGGYFEAVAAGPEALALHLLFMASTVAIVAFGVQDGIEWATKLMVPAIVVLLGGLAAWAATLDGVAAGYAFYLTPDLDALTGNIAVVVPAAVGQALFSLSLGMGVMITYSSYLSGADDIGVDGLSIVLTNTLVGLLAGAVVFPLLAAEAARTGTEPAFGAPGPGAIFEGMAAAFQTLPFGRVLGAVFFAVVALAALSSAISLLEVVVSYVVDNFAVSRPRATAALGFGMFLLGAPAALDVAVLRTFDAVASNVLLPVGAFLVVTFVGWVYGRSAATELRRGSPSLAALDSAWLWHVRTVLLVAVGMALAINLAAFLGINLG